MIYVEPTNAWDVGSGSECRDTDFTLVSSSHTDTDDQEAYFTADDLSSVETRSTHTDASGITTICGDPSENSTITPASTRTETLDFIPESPQKSPTVPSKLPDLNLDIPFYNAESDSEGAPKDSILSQETSRPRRLPKTMLSLLNSGNVDSIDDTTENCHINRSGCHGNNCSNMNENCNTGQSGNHGNVGEVTNTPNYSVMYQSLVMSSDGDGIGSECTSEILLSPLCRRFLHNSSTTPHKSPSTTPHRSSSTTPHRNPSTTPHRSSSTTPHRNPSTTPHRSSSTTSHRNPSTTPHRNPSTTPHKGPSTTPHRSPSTTPHKGPSTTPHRSPSTTPLGSPSTILDGGLSTRGDTVLCKTADSVGENSVIQTIGQVQTILPCLQTLQIEGVPVQPVQTLVTPVPIQTQPVQTPVTPVQTPLHPVQNPTQPIKTSTPLQHDKQVQTDSLDSNSDLPPKTTRNLRSTLSTFRKEHAVNGCPPIVQNMFNNVSTFDSLYIIHIHNYSYISAQEHTHTHARTHAHTHTHTHLLVHTHTHAHTHTHTLARTHTHAYNVM